MCEKVWRVGEAGTHPQTAPAQPLSVAPSSNCVATTSQGLPVPGPGTPAVGPASGEGPQPTSPLPAARRDALWGPVDSGQSRDQEGVSRLWLEP